MGPLHDPVTWYKIIYTGEQVAQWDFQNNATRTSSPGPAFVLKVPLRNLLTSIYNFVPCDRIVQRAHSTDLGLIDMISINLNAEIVACILAFRKSRHKPNLENTSKYGFSPDLGEKNGGVLSMRMQVILDSSFARPRGFSPYMRREERRVQRLD